jgi:hypothetical protein
MSDQPCAGLTAGAHVCLRYLSRDGEFTARKDFPEELFLDNLCGIHRTCLDVSLYAVLAGLVVRAFVNQLKLLLRLVGRVLRFIHSLSLYRFWYHQETTHPSLCL